MFVARAIIVDWLVAGTQNQRNQEMIPVYSVRRNRNKKERRGAFLVWIAPARSVGLLTLQHLKSQHLMLRWYSFWSTGVYCTLHFSRPCSKAYYSIMSIVDWNINHMSNSVWIDFVETEQSMCWHKLATRTYQLIYHFPTIAPTHKISRPGLHAAYPGKSLQGRHRRGRHELGNGRNFWRGFIEKDMDLGWVPI